MGMEYFPVITISFYHLNWFHVRNCNEFELLYILLRIPTNTIE